MQIKKGKNMNIKLTSTILLFCLTILIGTAGAVTVPSGMTGYAQLTVTSGNAINANTQIRYSFDAGAYKNYEASNLQNMQPFNGVSGALVTGYNDNGVSNTANSVAIWLKIPEAYTTDNNIYMGFYPISTNNYNSLGTWGEYYGLASFNTVVDNCKLAFGFCEEFPGNALSGAWSSYGSAAPTTVVNNGLTLTNNGGESGIYDTQSSAGYGGANAIIETYAYITATGNNNGNMGLGQYAAYCDAITTSTSAFATFTWGSTAGVCCSYNQQMSTPASYVTGNHILNIYNKGTTQISFLNYTTMLPVTTATVTANAPIILYSYNGGSTVYHWVRAYAATQDAIMPTVSYGAYKATSGVTSISISPNPITYPNNAVVLATGSSASDTVYIDYPTLGTHVATGTGSATWTVTHNAVGTYTLWANDITASQTATDTLTINKAPQIMTWTSQCTNPYLQWGSVPNPCTTAATISTFNNQVIATLYFNGNINGTTANTISSFLPTNMIGTDTWIFSAPPTTNYTSNSITYSTAIYVPLYIRNSSTTYSITPPSNILAFHYPWRLFTASPGNAITYTLNEISPTPSSLQQGLNISYVPPSNQVSATYVYNTIEQQGTSIISIQETIVGNMLVLKDTYPTFNSTRENFTNYPLALFIPNSQWYSKPTSWKLNGFTANVNGNVIDRYGNGTATLPLNVQVSFNGIGNFNLSMNTGLTKNTLSLMPNTYQASNTPPAYPYNGVLANITTYDAQSKDPLVATTSYTFTASINNYTIQVGTLSFTANNFQIYRPISTFQNPPIELFNHTMISSASGYYPQQNNFFANIYNSTSYAELHAYLPSAANASYYSITAYKCNGYATGDFVTLQLYGSPSTQVQQYLMSQMPFQLPLLNGYSYQFQVFTPNRQKVYSSPFTLWTSPIQITSACNQSAQNIVTPNITTSCSWVYGAAPSNQLIATCRGIDTMNLVNSWTIKWANQTNGLSQYVYDTVNITGSSFIANYTFPDNSISHTYLAIIQMHMGSTFDPTQQNSAILNPLPLAVQQIYGWFILVGMLLLAFILAWFDKIAFIIVLDVVGIVSKLINASPFTDIDITLLLVGSTILIAMAVWKSQGYTVR